MRLRLERGGGGGRGLVPSVIGSLVFLVCAVVGALATWATAADWLRIVASHGWPEVPCEIEASRVVEDASSAESYRFAVQYRYRYGGREYRSAVVAPSYTGSSDMGEAQRLALRYPAGSVAACIVDPDAPQLASLEHDSLWRILLVLATLIFFLVGTGGLWAMWGGKLTAESRAGDRKRPKRPSLGSQASSAVGGRGCLVGFFALFLAAGLGFFIPFFGLPAARVVAARGWQAVPCTIERSAVQTHSGDDGNTYSIEVLYSYELDGRTLEGNRYGFMGGSSGGYEGKARVVAGLPAGTRTTCWVDPEDPVESVLERGFTMDMLFGLLPLVFVVVGAGGMVFAWRGAGGAVPVPGKRGGGGRGAGARPARSRWLPQPKVKKHEASGEPARTRRRGLPPVPAGAGGMPSAVVLEPPHGPLTRFFGLLAITAFWNGIVGVFLHHVVIGWRDGAGDGCLTVFLVPFVLVGALLLVSVPHQFLALFNPRPRLVLSGATVPVGGTLLLEWSFRGAAGRLRRLRIVLEGREQATYRRGTSSSTSTEVFAEIPVIEHSRPHPLASGHATVQIPADTMHSFVAEHNEIAWRLKLHGEIRAWPDVAEEYELVVTPQEVR